VKPTSTATAAGLAPEGTQPVRSRPSLPLWSIVLLAVVAGVAVGRFVTAGNDGARRPTPSPLVQGQSTSIAELEQRVEANPDDLGAWQALGGAYIGRAAEVGDPSFYTLAEKALARAEALAPGDPATLLGQGRLALALHRFPEALDLGQRLVEQLPASADALAVLVDAQVELGRYDEAEVSLQRMLDLRPGLPALARASYLRELHGDVPGAIEAMTRAEAAGSAASDRANVAALLGSLQFRQGNLAAAADSYQRALDAAPGLVLAEVGRARVLAGEGEVDDAIEVLEQVVERFPAPEAVILLGDLQAARGLDAATETYALVGAIAALQEEAGQIVDLEMAVFEADRGEDPARALELATRAHDARPGNVYAADALAWARLRSGDATGAVAPMESALRLGTADPLVRFHAAEVFSALGDSDRARTELTEAVSGGTSFSLRHHDRVLALAAQLGVETLVPTGG
jgi:tetratricopeptide (TPR) repeat protein